MRAHRFVSLAASVALALGGITLSATAVAKQLRFAVGSPPNSDIANAAEVYTERLGKYTDGELTARVYPLSLLNFAESSDGVRDGLADIAFLLTPYHANEYAHTNLLAEMSMMVTLLEDADPDKISFAYTGAMLEYMFNSCPECLQEYAKQNQVLTSVGATTNYILICAKPMHTLNQLRSARIRTGGPQWARWARALDATPVTISVNEAFEALSQGVVDCTTQTPVELVNFMLNEVATDITLHAPAGLFAGIAPANVNATLWRSMSESNRRAALRAGADLSAEFNYTYVANSQPAIQKSQDKGVVVREADASLLKATADFARNDLKTIPARYESVDPKRGAEMVAAMQVLLDKWVRLVADVESSADLAKLYWDEVYSKIDVSTYGMQ